MKEFVYKYARIFTILFAILSLSAVTPYWWLSVLPFGFFCWNLFAERKHLRTTITFLILIPVLLVFNFRVLTPLHKMQDEMQAEWNKTGYHERWLPGAQEAINVLARKAEEYKANTGVYPDDLADMGHVALIMGRDLSYRVKEADGQVNGMPFYYEKVDTNKFLLAGVGKDGKINTDDDLLPQISLKQSATTGLVRYVTKTFSISELDREKGVMNMLERGEKIYHLLDTNEMRRY